MASLTSTLSIAAQSLMVQDAEISVTNNNIANANTAGYTREQAVTVEADPISIGTISIGDGVELMGIQSLRDELLTNQIQQQTSQQSSASAQVNGLNDVQTLFPVSGTNLSTQLSSFFTSLSALSTNPTSSAARQTVIANGETLASGFNSIAAGLSSTQTSLESQVTTDVNSINALSQQAATLNTEIRQQASGSQGQATLTDQLSQVEVSLSNLTNISVTRSSDGDTITTGNGTPLVVGAQSHALQTVTGANGLLQVVDNQGNNITSSISGGDLGGTLKVRDTDIPNMMSQLDTIAHQFGTEMNTANAQGTDLNGATGGQLFNVTPGVTGSAASISMTTTNPSAIALSSDGSTGSDGNLANLTSVESLSPTGGSSITALSSNLVYQVGEVTLTATTEQTAITQSLNSLNMQQSSVSGVSIDEESANLLRYQQAYQASAQVINTVNTLMATTMSMMTA